jgi:peptidoglycan-N-acetylglucosamine deacetylase
MAIRVGRALVAAIIMVAMLAAPAFAQSPPGAPGAAVRPALAAATAPGSLAVANEGGVPAARSSTPVPGGVGSGGDEDALPGRARAVALTFDDGPDPRWTPQVLALLRAARVHATFCLIGRQVAAYPRLVARIVAEGHRLCNHTFDHDEQLATRPVPVINRDIQAATAAIKRAVPGASIRLFRAPGGGFTVGLDQLLPAQGLRPLGWSVDPDDWRRPGAAAIVARVLAQVRPGSIILLHDGGGDRSQTVAALQQLLPALTARGYRFVQP